MDQQPSLLGAAALSTGASASMPSQGLPSWPGTTPYSQQIPAEVIDQIEVLKQQLRIYADDFATEREDRERNQAEKEKMKEELNTMKEQVQALEQQVGFVHNNTRCGLEVISIGRQTLRKCYCPRWNQIECNLFTISIILWQICWQTLKLMTHDF